MSIVHPYDNYNVIAGQGTIAIEFLEQVFIDYLKFQIFRLYIQGVSQSMSDLLTTYKSSKIKWGVIFPNFLYFKTPKS